MPSGGKRRQIGRTLLLGFCHCWMPGGVSRRSFQDTGSAGGHVATEPAAQVHWPAMRALPHPPHTPAHNAPSHAFFLPSVFPRSPPQGPPQDCDREGLPGGGEQGDQGLPEVLSHTQVHGVQLRRGRGGACLGVGFLGREPGASTGPSSSSSLLSRRRRRVWTTAWSTCRQCRGTAGQSAIASGALAPHLAGL